MTQDTIALARFDETHLDAALSLSQAAGWPHRREDWAMVLSLSHGVVALHEDAVVGTAMTTPIGDEAATINMVIVAEAMRGRGLGRRLMEAALQPCGAREARLVATQEGLPLYEKLGFVATHAIQQHQGIATGADIPASGASWAHEGDSGIIADLDRSALGLNRQPLLRLLSERGRLALLRDPAGRASGYGALRRFGRGEVIGPVIAETIAGAQALIGFLMAERRGAFLRVDTPEAAGLGDWLAGLGLAHVGGGIAMRRAAVARPTTTFKTFALASQALG